MAQANVIAQRRIAYHDLGYKDARTLIAQCEVGTCTCTRACKCRAPEQCWPAKFFPSRAIPPSHPSPAPPGPPQADRAAFVARASAAGDTLVVADIPLLFEKVRGRAWIRRGPTFST